MMFHIKEWQDGHATLMTETGEVLWTFSSIDEAKRACRDWSNIHRESIECYAEN